MINFIKENKEFAFIFLLAVIIRFIPAFEYQFSFDELSALSRTIYANWHDLVLYGARIDAHPILIQCFLYAMISIFGYAGFLIKLPFILFSLAAIFYGYKFSFKLYGKLPALLTAAVYSFSFIFLFYSPLARMYSSGLFFSTALLYYLFNSVFDENKTRKDNVLTALFFLLCALNSHISCLFALSLGISGLFFINKKTIWPYLISCIAAVFFYLPHLPITFFQLQYGGIGAAQNGWLPPPGKLAFLEFIKVALGTGYTWVFFVALIIVSVTANKLKVINRNTILLLGIFFFNYFVIYFYSILKAPVFQYSVMLFSAPALITALSGSIRFKEKFTIPVVSVISGILLFQSLFVKEFFTSAVLNQNEFQYDLLRQTAAKYGKDKVEAVFYDTEKFFLMYYELRDGKKQSYRLGDDTLISGVKQFRSFLKNSKAQKIIIGNPSPSQIELVNHYFPFLEDYKETANVSCYIFSKFREGNSDKALVKPVISSSLFYPGEYSYNCISEKLNKRDNEFVFEADSNNEYPFGVNAPMHKVALKNGNIILAKIKLQSDTVLDEVSFNCVIKNDKDSTMYFGGQEVKGFYSQHEPYWVYCELFVGSEFDKWIKQNSKVTFFIWNRSKNNFLIKDVEILTYDFRPKRWSLWE